MRLQVEHSGGRLINVTGDGTFSLFDGPTHAVRCADEIRKSAEELGISVRAGVHAGELERTGRDLTGLSVHVGARVGAMAMPNEVLVSRTVRDLGGGLWARVRRPAFAHAERCPGTLACLRTRGRRSTHGSPDREVTRDTVRPCRASQRPDRPPGRASRVAGRQRIAALPRPGQDRSRLELPRGTDRHILRSAPGFRAPLTATGRTGPRYAQALLAGVRGGAL